MLYWILPVAGNVQSHTSVQHVTQKDFVKPKYKAANDVFLADLKAWLNDNNFLLWQDPNKNLFYLDDEPKDPAYPLASEQPDYEGDFPKPIEDMEDAGVDHYLNAEVIMETDNGPWLAWVI